jgi:tetratricopeptide (TPR) repeat protein
MLKSRPDLLALGLLAALCSALYLPFLGNPPFFDDGYVFSGYKFYEHAASPFALALRQPAYFTLAFVQVLWGSMAAHRLTSLLFHVCCAWALYVLIRELQRSSPPASTRAGAAPLVALVAAAAFALHPVAVYAAGYLVQRSIVLATLFGLLSVTLYLRGLRTRRYADAFSAGALFSLAVLSKEHALLLPAAAAAGVWLRGGLERFQMRYTGAYFAACAPAAVLVALMAKGILGQAYEPDFNEVAAQVGSPAETGGSPWAASALTQAGLFFRYVALWLWPQTARMALDIRVDMHAGGSPLLSALGVAAFIGYGVIAAFLISRRGRSAMAGFGLLLPWILFLLEFAVVRFQEPFVLYRSYLWAPGLAIALAAALAAGLPDMQLPKGRAVLGATCALLVVLGWQAQDRLRSFSSGVALWEDAASKLPSQPVAGGWRTLYNLGRAYLYAEKPQQAVAAVERCMAQYPEIYHCLYARAAIHVQLGEYEAAIPHVMRAIAARPLDGSPRHQLGVVLEELGCREQARAQYQQAFDLGFIGAKFRLQNLDTPGRGLLPPRAARPVQGFACPS